MLLTPQLAPFQLDVADLRFNESTFRQRATISDLHIKFLGNGCCELRLLMPRQAYGLDSEGGYGDPVPASYLHLEPVRLLGDRNVAVDPTDGFPRYRLRTAGTPTSAGSALNTLTQQEERFELGQSWEDFLEALPGTYILQDRYFGEMCASGQVNINALLALYAAQADAAPSLFAVQPALAPTTSTNAPPHPVA